MADLRPQHRLPLYKNPIFWAFTLSILYWLHLILTTSMVIKYDAEAYEILGSTIAQNGLTAFFKLKPDNVILYPWIISLAMRMGRWLGIPYYPVQTVIQVLFLFAGQVLLYKTLKRLGIRRSVSAGVLLYFGFSPAIVNSAFSLYCEIITYPLTLGILLLSLSAWQRVATGNYWQNIVRGLEIALLFWIITLVRQVNEYVIVIYLFTIFLLSLRFWAGKNLKAFVNSIVLILTVFGAFHLGLIPYKAMTYKYNGYKTLTSVGSESIYANAKGRTMPLSAENVKTFLARVPGDGVCLALFGFEKCDFWGDRNIHAFGPLKVRELTAQGYDNDAIDRTLKESAIRHVFGNPLQYAFLTAAEGFKMVFWESTQIGFVTYPEWLTRLFTWTPFKDGLRLLVFVITLVTLALGFIYTARHWKDLTAPDGNSAVLAAYVICLVIIVANIILHAPFMIATRYALPIAPLYLVLFGLNWEYCFRKSK